MPRTRKSLAETAYGDPDSLGLSMDTLPPDDVKPTTRRSTRGKSAIGTSHAESSSGRSSVAGSASGYSTPATSTVPTPISTLTAGQDSKAAAPKDSITVIDMEDEEDTSMVSATRERAARYSKFNLSGNNKRKRPAYYSLDTDDDDDDDDQFDSDMARAIKTSRKEMARSLGAHIGGAYSDVSIASSFPKTRSSSRSAVKDTTVGSSLRKSNVPLASLDGSESDVEMFQPAPPRRSTRPQTSLRYSTTANASLDGSEVADSELDGAPPKARFTKTQTSLKNSTTANTSLAGSEVADSEDEFFGTVFARPKRITRAQNRTAELNKSLSKTNIVIPVSLAKGEALNNADNPFSVDEKDAIDLTAVDSDAGFNFVPAQSNKEPDTGSDSEPSSLPTDLSDSSDSDVQLVDNAAALAIAAISRRGRQGVRRRAVNRVRGDRDRLVLYHPVLNSMWDDLRNMALLNAGKVAQPKTISRQLKDFQLEGVAWMIQMEKTDWKGGLLGDEMGLGKTIQAVSLIMSDFPARKPTLVLVPPVALMQWMNEIAAYTDGTLTTFVYHGTNAKSKSMKMQDLKKYHVIIMSYNSLESMYRKQEKGFKRQDGIFMEESVIHKINFHRIILDEAHSIKTRSTMTAKACFALKTDYRWCLSGTPLQNRIGELYSLIRFLGIQPFSSYFCKQCSCSAQEWQMDEDGYCPNKSCQHSSMSHVNVFNHELLNPIQRYGNNGEGKEAFQKLRLLTDRIMLRRLKRDHTNAMELPVKEIYVDRQFFGEEENDFANSIMTNGQRRFDTYVAQGVLLNNYANIFGLIMQMRQVADHPDLILKKNGEGGQNLMVCCICDETAEEAIRSRCHHDFCRACARTYLNSQSTPDCPHCHIPLVIDLEQPEIEQDENLVKKTSIINRIKMENWTSSSKIELLVHELHKMRSRKASHKSIIFSQFTTMLQLIEWRLRRAGITTVMLDGSMTPAQRQASIDHFKSNVDVECFLVSLKAGGVALNLTEASRVFIVDPWWNPAAEWQSADRCHRIGQSRPCTITRLCIEDSVESRMVLLQEKKSNMIKSTINADDNAMDSLTPQDLQFLFRGN